MGELAKLPEMDRTEGSLILVVGRIICLNWPRLDDERQSISSPSCKPFEIYDGHEMVVMLVKKAYEWKYGVGCGQAQSKGWGQPRLV